MTRDRYTRRLEQARRHAAREDQVVHRVHHLWSQWRTHDACPKRIDNAKRRVNVARATNRVALRLPANLAR